MTLPAPNLDDRGFQDLVDEAKRLVQLRNPEWTDHNVSDPGVTLIETFAYMTDQLIYRLNRIPDLHYVKFLDLLGEKMIPPSAAVARIEFWLSVAQEVDIEIPRGTLVSTVRSGNDRAITFATAKDFWKSLCSVAPRVPADSAARTASFIWPRICGSPSTMESRPEATRNACRTACCSGRV